MAWYRRLLNAMRPERHSRDLDREMGFHLAERTDELVTSGMSMGDAGFEARRRFGNRTTLRERVREVDALAWLSSLSADIRYARRTLVASPGFALVAIMSVALGIGANTTIFTLTNSLILKSLPVHRPEQLIQVTLGNPDNATFTNPVWEQVRDRATMFSGAFAWSMDGFNLASGGEERPASGAWVSGDFFNVLGVQPAAGRLLQRSDDRRGCVATAVVSSGFAEREFGGAAGATGRSVSLNGHPFDVVGVAAAGFFGIEVGRSADIYAPLCAQALLYGPTVLDARSRWYLSILARPKDGVSMEQVRSGLAAVAPGIFATTLPPKQSATDQREYLGTPLGAEPAATGLSVLRTSYRLALLTLMVVVGVVLAIACANIANLLLARASARQREIAIRLAIGASRARLVRQLLTESLLLAFTGAALGVLFAKWASRLLVAFLGTGVRAVSLDLSLDGRVLAFTIAVATLTAVLFGLVPAWRATRVDPQATLKAGGRGLVKGDTRHSLGKALVVAQVALSLALVAASGLLLGSFRKLATLDPGFRRDGVLLVAMQFRNAGYKAEQLNAVETDILRRIRASPAVATAATSALTPIGRMTWNDVVAVPGFTPASRKDSLVYFNQVSDGYFTAMGTTLLAGRDFDADDITQLRHVAVVSETMARRFFGTVNPLGHTFRVIRDDSGGAPKEIVGVVRDTKYQRLDEKTLATAYFPVGQSGLPTASTNLVIRTSASPTALVPMVRAMAAEVNPAISLSFTTLEAQVSASLTRPRLLAALSGFFGLLALVLAVIGLYGTMSYNVTRRRNEIGIRMALGAADRQVLRMVAAEAARLIVLGIAVGAALAFATTRLISSLLFGLTPTDPTTLGVSALALGAVAMVAAFFPAWRAARLDPMDALREE